MSNEIPKHISNADVPRPSNDKLVQMCSEVTAAIEKCGASPDLTAAVIKASDLWHCLLKPEPTAAAIRNAALEEAAEFMLPALRDMISRSAAAIAIRSLKEQPPKEVQDALAAAESALKTLRREKFDAESKVRRLEQRIAELEKDAVPAGWKLVPDWKVGMAARFRGKEFKIIAHGDYPDTFDLALPDGTGDRWLNVSPNMLLPVSKPPIGKQ